jgi:hypothetical protein
LESWGELAIGPQKFGANDHSPGQPDDPLAWAGTALMGRTYPFQGEGQKVRGRRNPVILMRCCGRVADHSPRAATGARDSLEASAAAAQNRRLRPPPRGRCRMPEPAAAKADGPHTGRSGSRCEPLLIPATRRRIEASPAPRNRSPGLPVGRKAAEAKSTQ